MREKETLLVRSNYSFSHSIFKRLVPQTRKNKGLFGKGFRIQNHKQTWGCIESPFHRRWLVSSYICYWSMFNPFQNKPLFLHVCITSLLKTLWEKEKLLVTSNFSFSHTVFYPFKELSPIFIHFEIVICKLFQFERI